MATLSILLHITLAGALHQSACVAAASAPALDHVVLAVHDLDRAAAAFQAHGFRIKRGRLHANNLLNRHIKFRDGSSLELMTVAGPPGDAMAEDYARLLKEGAGAVYLALSISDIAPPARAAAALGLESRRSSSGPWQFLSFPPGSPAATVFLSAGNSQVTDPDSLVTHEPGVDGLREVWVEGGPALADLLRRLGAQHCGKASSGAGSGDRWALRRGYVVIVPARTEARARVLGVVLQSRNPGLRALNPIPGFHVEYASSTK